MRYLHSLIAAIAVAAGVIPAAATQLKFVEDFKTFDYASQLYTTADWDTAAGEVRLFPYQMTAEDTYALGFAKRVVVHGSRIYAAHSNAGLRILDANTRAQIGSYLPSSYIADVLVSADVAVVSRGGFGVDLVDVHAAGSTALIKNVATSGAAGALIRNGKYVYVAAGTGLDVIDISVPSTAVAVNAIPGPIGSGVQDMAIQGNYLYIAAQGIVLVCDLSGPALPAPVQSFGSGWFAYGVEAQNNTLYVSDWIGGLRVIDITNPLSPFQATTVALPASVWDAAADGTWLYVAAGTELHALDITSPMAPVVYGSVGTGGTPLHVALYGRTAVVANDFAGVRFVRVADASSSLSIGTPAPTTGQTRGVAVDGQRLYICQDVNGLDIYDISDPDNPAFLGNAPTADATTVAVQGNYAYVADWAAGLTVVDVSDPTTPVTLTTLALPGYADRLAVDGGIAVVSQGSNYNGFAVVDISSPAAPALADTFAVGPGYGVALDYPYAYVTSGGAGAIRVVDLSDPTNTTFAGSLPGASSTSKFSAEGNRLIFTNGNLNVVDISNPTLPAVLGSIPAPNVNWVMADGDVAYGITNQRDLIVWDISNPAVIAQVDSIRVADSGSSLWFAAGGDFVYMSMFSSGVYPIQVHGRHFDQTANIARSEPILLPPDVQQIRWTGTKTDSIDLAMSLSYQAWTDTPFQEWTAVAQPPTNVVWRSIHRPAAHGENPSMSQLVFEFRYLYPVIEAITDVGGDQGGQVRIQFARSSCDFNSLDNIGGIDEYAVYRLITPGQAAALDASGQRKHHPLRPTPANWDYVGSVPARYWDGYALVVPTLADSVVGGGANYTTFMVSALGPFGFYDSPADSGYSIDNLVPNVPANLVVAYNATANHLNWSQSPDADFQYFRVYRGNDPGFTPEPSALVHATTATSWFDLDAGSDVYYKVTAVDLHGNESAAAPSSPVTAVPDARNAFALGQNVPNPFNPATTIAYSLPRGVEGNVSLRVYDVTGRLVRTLVDEPARAGAFTATWDGRDGRGSRVGSGVYFYTLDTPGHRTANKMVMIE